MSLSVKAGTGSIPAATTTQQTVTGVGFTPTLAIIHSAFATADDASSVSTNWAMGAASSAADCWAFGARTTDAASTRGMAAYSGSFLVGANTTAATPVLLASFDAFTSDGFQFTPGTNTAGIVKYGYLCLGGTDITSVKCGTFSSGTVATTVSVNCGFQPSIIILVAAGQRSTSGNTNSGNATPLFGVWDGTNYATTSMEHNASAYSATRYSTTKIIRGGWNSGATVAEATISGTSGSGFDVLWSVAPSTDTMIGYIAIAGGIRAKVGAITQATDGTGTEAYTGVGFQPEALVLFGPNLAAESTTTAKMAFGVASSTTARWSTANSHTDTGTTFTADKNWYTNRITQSVLDGTPTQESAADLTSFDSNGFTLNYSVNDNVARNIYYLALRSASLPDVDSATTAPFKPGDTATFTGTNMNVSTPGIRMRKVGGTNAYDTLSYTPTNSTTGAATIINRPARTPYTTASHTVEFIATTAGVVNATATPAYTLNPPTGYSVVELTSAPTTDPASLVSYVSGVTPAATDQIEYQSTITVSLVTVTATVATDGTVFLDSTPDPMPATVTMKWRYYSAANEIWSGSASDQSDWATATFGSASAINTAGKGSVKLLQQMRRRRPD